MICPKGECGAENLPEGTTCMDSTCDGEGECRGHERCESSIQCMNVGRRYCDGFRSLCTECTVDEHCGDPEQVLCAGNGSCECVASFLTFCNKKCRDISEDIDHCGGCFRQCSPGGVCANGQCF